MEHSYEDGVKARIHGDDAGAIPQRFKETREIAFNFRGDSFFTLSPETCDQGITQQAFQESTSKKQEVYIWDRVS